MYILVMRQSEGCDYTIGCGVRVVQIDAYGPGDALAAAAEHLREMGGLHADSESRIDTVELYEASRVPFDLERLRAAHEAALDADEQAQRDAAEHAEFQRLKAKFQG